MSSGGTVIELRWAALIADSGRWADEHRQACHASAAGSYDDWVGWQLRQVMQEAGLQFMRDNPDLFQLGELF